VRPRVSYGLIAGVLFPAVKNVPQVKTDPDIKELLQEAVAHHQAGRWNEAQAGYLGVLSYNPRELNALNLLGTLAQGRGEIEQSRDLFRRAIAVNPGVADVHYNLGRSYGLLGDNGAAEASFKLAVDLAPDHLGAHTALTALYAQDGRLAQAVGHMREAVRIAPHPKSHSNLGELLRRSGDLEAAIDAHAVAFAALPHDSTVLHNYGAALLAADRLDDARRLFQQALVQNPRHVPAQTGLAKVYERQGLIAEAIATLERALMAAPDSPDLLFQLSVLQLINGNLRAGWQNYEHRFATHNDKPAPLPGVAIWNGEDLRGKSIFLHTEQGVGDEILFAGMIADVVSRARLCILGCTPRLAPVFARSFPAAMVIPYDEKGRALIPPGMDYQIASSSLGRFVRKDMASFPRHQGYLKADPERTAALRGRYQAVAPGNLVVGLSWRSKNEELGATKSAELASWGDLLIVPGVTFVNLQYGDCAGELAAVRQALGVAIVQDRDVDPLKDMDAFFAQVTAMDLVISTSNTTAHVAGSLNVPTWLLLPARMGGLWYWFLERTDSPWYPALRIFRQSPVDLQTDTAKWWSGAVARAADALRSQL